MTNNGPGLIAIPLTPSPEDHETKEGQCAVTPDGTIWQHSKGFWREYPWWQRCDAEEIIATCADSDEYAYNLSWTRAHIEERIGAFTFITLPQPEDKNG